MIKRIFYSLSLFSSFIFADPENIANLLNEALSHNYSFVERSLNQSDLRIEESAGEILFNTSNGFVVNILSPFKERYEVSQDKVTIFDLELNQSRAMSLEDINSIFIKVLVSGLSTHSTEYTIIPHDSNNFSILPADNSPEIKFIFNKNILSLIRYTDNLGIEHGIELTRL
jgi:outer membrane lipoprotein-sorting protein